MAGYAFAKMDFPLKESLFLAVLSMLMIPLVTTLIPLYLLVRAMGLQNTYLGIILPGLAAPMGIFLMRTLHGATSARPRERRPPGRRLRAVHLRAHRPAARARRGWSRWPSSPS